MALHAEFDLEKLWNEWTVETKIGHEIFPPLGELERQRTQEGYKYRRPSNKKLKEAVRRRRVCCEYIEELGGRDGPSAFKAACEVIGRVMGIEKGPKWSLNMLYDVRCAQLAKKNKAAATEASE